MPGIKIIRHPLFLLLILLALLSACTAAPPAYTPTAAPRETPPASFAEMSQAELADRVVRLVISAEKAARGLSAFELSALPAEISQTQAALTQATEAIATYTNLFSEIDPPGKSAAMLEVATNQLAETASLLEHVQETLAAAPVDAAALSSLLATLEDTPLLREVLRSFRQQVAGQIEQREIYYMNIAPQPGQVASNRVEAFIQAHDFVDAFNTALADDQFSASELEALSQVGANAEASLYNTGSHPLFAYARQIDQITRQAVRGEWPAAREGLFELQRTLPARPQG